MIELADDAAVVAVYRDGTRWFVLATCVGRIGVHRVAVVDETNEPGMLEEDAVPQVDSPM
jgi:hypothetical protein